MNIYELLEDLRVNPKEFNILGKGAHCLALVNRRLPNSVLLLEIGKEAKSGGNDIKVSAAHARAVGFARQSDEILDASLGSYLNHAGRPYIHPSLEGSASAEKLGKGIFLHIGNGQIFEGHSARLIRRIPGRALHFLDFVDKGASGLSRKQVDGLADDIAAWMYVLHHEVSAGSMAKNKIQKQFQDAGKSIVDRPLRSDKYNIFVTQNVNEIGKLSSRLSTHNMHEEYERSLLSNFESSGVNFELMEQSALLLERRLKILLPKDRIGLTHTDMHPGNIIVNNEMTAVNGICDWMSAGIDAQSVDFAGLGLAKGLLPRVVKAYSKREKDNKVTSTVSHEAIYAYAAMRNIYIALKGVKNGFGNGNTARIAWEQAGECFDQLSRIDTVTYGAVARRHKRQSLPPIRQSAQRNTFKTHPSFVAKAG